MSQNKNNSIDASQSLPRPKPSKLASVKKFGKKLVDKLKHKLNLMDYATPATYGTTFNQDEERKQHLEYLKQNDFGPFHEYEKLDSDSDNEVYETKEREKARKAKERREKADEKIRKERSKAYLKSLGKDGNGAEDESYYYLGFA
ncbi:hypothetical protein F5Y18DRAFT_437672 [Xylariaceae sp. FL1019]|nr:hypothetical protein F5Y18DRAFT_437672 [Xylariaceae sp. FL1019]